MVHLIETLWIIKYSLRTYSFWVRCSATPSLMQHDLMVYDLQFNGIFVNLQHGSWLWILRTPRWLEMKNLTQEASVPNNCPTVQQRWMDGSIYQTIVQQFNKVQKSSTKVSLFCSSLNMPELDFWAGKNVMYKSPSCCAVHCWHFGTHWTFRKLMFNSHCLHEKIFLVKFWGPVECCDWSPER